MIRTIFHLGLALSLVAIVGCGQDTVTQDDVPGPSEGVQIINENPSSPTVDVPGTRVDESAMDDEPVMSPPVDPEGSDPAAEAVPDESSEEPTDESNVEPVDAPVIQAVPDEANDEQADEPNDESQA